MASRSLGALTLDLIAKTGGFVEGLTKAERETTKRTQAMQTQLRDLKNEAIDLGKAGAAAFAAMVTGAAVMGVAFYRAGSQSVSALAGMSDQIGVATEDLGALRFAAQQMSGMAEGTFDVSMRRMARRITEAADGAGPAVGALKSLRLEAGELARMSPDAQFRAIADAMKEIPTQGERLRATMAIFDTEGVPLINTLMQGSEAIGELEERAHSLGLTISRVDAAQVEAANNALAESAATMAAFQQQLAVQFAPVVKAATDLITGMSDELGGMDSVAERAFNNVINGMAFLANAADGAGRVFKIFSATVIGTFSQMVHRVLGGVDMILFGYQQLAEVFGLDTIASGIGALRDFGVLSGEIAAQAAADIDRMLSEELAGNKFKRFVADAREAGREAAEALVGTGAIDVPEMPGLPDADTGMSEKEREAIEKRLDTLRESFYTEQQMLGAKYVEEQRLLDEALALRQETLAEADLTEAQRLAEGAALEEEFGRLRLQSTQRYEEGMTKISQKEAAARNAVLGRALSGLTTLMNSENRKMFEIGKTAAIAQSLVATWTGMSEALKLGWPLGPIAAGAIALTGFANVASIRATTFGGGGGAASTTSAVNGAMTPVAPSPAQLAPGQPEGGGQGVSVVVNVNGSLIGAGGVEELTDVLVDRISDKVNRGDHILIDARSRNGQMLR